MGGWKAPTAKLAALQHEVIAAVLRDSAAEAGTAPPRPLQGSAYDIAPETGGCEAAD
jgi:hypothetical protein